MAVYCGDDANHISNIIKWFSMMKDSSLILLLSRRYADAGHN